MAKRAALKKRSKALPKVPPPMQAPPAPSASEAVQAVPSEGDWIAEAWRYQVDLWQRHLLFLDTLRERANNMLAHEQEGLSPLLKFEYETVLDAHTFDRPANYALLRVTGATMLGDKCAEDCVKEGNRPVIVIDPRAGHGPGIGGFKRDSEVGIAMHEGHPVYFVSFFPEPCGGQTLSDVLHALRRFVQEVVGRHPDAAAPVLYGNCQAGWAVALLSAHCEGLTGPAVLNGSPLSYWSGAERVNPMRLAAGLVGGSWSVHFLSDLGNGRFDGAWLVYNFENLNPGHTWWDKLYQLHASIDEERERFLDFERWWTGFYFFSKAEITAIVENLFIGNALERGELGGLCRVCEGCLVDLKRIRNPLVIFASSGDNITPPHQALGWVPAVYPDTRALQAARQRIVYLLNPHVGHLGLFVSASVARLEHRAILESIEELEALKPGLYEMKILNPTGDPDCRKPQYSVRFEQRRVEDILFPSPPRAFETVRELSEINTRLYETLAGPWVRAWATPWAAELLKWFHPMRVACWWYFERLNPWMWPVATLAEAVRRNRRVAGDENAFLERERQWSKTISRGLDTYRQLRDGWYEQIFRSLYATRSSQ